jgi:VWFA-related protein
VPRFRAGVEGVVVDVSVLDKDRRPVRGLTGTDFTLLEDGRPQEAHTFKEIDLGSATRPPGPAWSAEHPPDVRRNDEFRDRSVLVIVLDGSTPMAAEDIVRAKEVGAKVIERMEPGDFAAVVHTMDKPAGQDFTQDRDLLRASVKRLSGTTIMSRGLAPAFQIPPPGTGVGIVRMNQDEGGVDPVLCRVTLSALSGIVKTLSALQEQRKAVIFVSPGMPLDPRMLAPQGMGVDTKPGALHEALFKELFAIIGDANRANVSFYGIDPGGLRVNPSPLRDDFLKSVSLDTGGLAVLNANNPTKQIDQIYLENQHYYMLGYQPSNPRTEGRFRKIEVRVNRPDATVRTRSGYYEPRKTSTSRVAAAPRVTDALQGALPVGDLPLAMTAACFAGRSGKRADVAVAVEAAEPTPAGQVAATSDVEVAAHAYDKGAKLKASQRVTHRLAIQPDAGRAIRYALLSRLELEPGRYQLRVAVRSSLTGHQGSVYYDLVVPDFTKATLATSNIVLDVRPRTPSAPAGAFTSLLPFDPTARREFRGADQVTAMLRVYQHGSKDTVSVRVTGRILDRDGKVVWTGSRDLAPEEFGTRLEADYRIELPVTVLSAGQYLLEVAAGAGILTARSDLRFHVR